MEPLTSASPLAQPLLLAGVAIRNRMVMAPMTTNYADDRGYVSAKTLSYYEERARGGVGAIVFEAAYVNPTARLSIRQHGIADDSFLPGLAELVRRVHAHGARIFVQISHAGPKASSRLNGVQPVSASEVPVKISEVPRPATRDEIPAVIEDFVAAAARARKAGFDGVELHTCHFYLLSAFLSPHMNHRADEYGGSLENRTLLPRQVIRGIKDRVGADYPVICRINGRERLPDGIGDEEARGIAVRLVEAGADALHVSAVTADVDPRIASAYAIKIGGPPAKDEYGCWVPYAASVKQVVNVPVIAVGKLNDPAVAEKTLRDGSADAVAIGRGLIADPYLVAKVLSGRQEEIDRCKECRTCHTTLWKQLDVDCSVNPKPWKGGKERKEGKEGG